MEGTKFKGGVPNPETSPLTREAFYAGMIEGFRTVYTEVLETKEKEIRKLNDQVRMLIRSRSYRDVGEVLRNIRLDDEVEYPSDLLGQDEETISVNNSDDELDKAPQA